MVHDTVLATSHLFLLKCQVRRPSLLWTGCRLRNGGITKLLQWVHTNYPDIKAQANKHKQNQPHMKDF